MQQPTPEPREPWTLDAGTVVAALGVIPERGLDQDEVALRLQAYGHNRLRETRRTSIAEIFINQLKSLIVALLLCATAVSLMFGEWVEGAAIGAAILIAVTLGFLTELRAIRSMEALRLFGTVDACVRRGGRDGLVPARDLVPGDIVLIEGGDRITADLRVIDASKLQADESTLTGESLPVGKDNRLLAATTPLAERRNMHYKGTVITRGSGLGVVVATAMNTELGHIAALVEEAALAVAAGRLVVRSCSSYAAIAPRLPPPYTTCSGDWLRSTSTMSKRPMAKRSNMTPRPAGSCSAASWANSRT